MGVLTNGYYRRSQGGEPLCANCHHFVRLHGARRGCFCVIPPEMTTRKDAMDYARFDYLRGEVCPCARTPRFFQAT